MMTTRTAAILRLYLLFLGMGLLVQGIVSMILIIGNIQVPALIAWLVKTDALHATIHISWGFILLILLFRKRSKRLLVLLGLSFSVFYLILGFLGILIHHPFGMLLGWRENIFHFLTSLVALTLSLQVSKGRRNDITSD